MTERETNAANLVQRMKPIFGTVSGSLEAGYRVAVRNKTAEKQLTALALQYGAVVEPLFTPRYPRLIKVNAVSEERRIGQALRMAK